MKICTWNINSVRLRIEMILELFSSYKIDILLLQETKCDDSVFPIDFLLENGINAIYNGQKSYNGVAILAKNKIELLEKSIPNIIQDSPYKNARYIEGLIYFNGENFKVASIYVPNGDDDVIKIEESQRFQFKLNFLEALYTHFKNNQDYMICGGDYNVAKTKIDLFSYKSAYGGVGCHPLEHEKMAQLDSVFVDIFRELYPDKNGYSWYDYRHGRWQKKEGWRIDYHYISQNLKNKIKDCYLIEDMRDKEKPSDHVPLVLEI